MTFEEKMKEMGYSIFYSIFYKYYKCDEETHYYQMVDKCCSAYISFKPGKKEIIDNKLSWYGFIKSQSDIDALQIAFNNLKRDVEEIEKFLEENNK